MARLHIKTQEFSPGEVAPGCNYVGREGENEILLPHPSVSRRHCEVWLTEEAVLIRDLDSRNGTFIDGERVTEAQLLDGQILRVGDVELELSGAPVRISVPDLPLPMRKEQTWMPDGTPCCFRHDGVASKYQCTGKCAQTFCSQCVRELRVAGGVPRRFCPECGAHCERLAATVREAKRPSWLNKIRDVLMKPPSRRP